MSEKPEEKEIKTKKRGPIKMFFKSFVDVRRWISYDEISTNAKTTFGLFKRFFSRREDRTIYQETYEESVIRLNMNDAQLARRKKIFLYSALVYLIFAIILFVHLVYLLVRMRLYTAFFDLVLLSFVSITAYREHFWYMQMQKRKLGCNFREWLYFVLGR